MSHKSDNPTPFRLTFTGVGSAIGLVVGGILGLAVDNLILFSGGGLVLGSAIGASIDLREKPGSQ